MNRILLLAAAAVAVCGCKTDTYVIEGELPQTEGVVYLYQNDRAVDSTLLEKGKFRFKGKVETPAVATLRMGQGCDFRQTVFLEPGTITVSENRTTGTPANDAYDLYNTRSRDLIARYNAAADKRESAAIESRFDSLTRAVFDANRTNLFGVLLFTDQIAYELSGAEMLAEIDKFPQELQQTSVLTDARTLAQAKLRTDPGQAYMGIELPDRKGDNISLASVVGNPANRYVLVDFWASWCGPCMGEVPYLVETYRNFHSKGFEIYGVSLDKNRDAWLAAVDGHGMEWLQVSPLTGFGAEPVRQYAVKSIPSNFLIDTSTGRFVASNLRGEALPKKIAELLAE